MGVYIKGMEMPLEKSRIIQIYPDGTVRRLDGSVFNSHFEAVPVPTRGRLIDSDALMREFDKAQRTMEQHGREYSCSFMSDSRELSTEWYCVEDMLENATTIIEAEEGE